MTLYDFVISMFTTWVYSFGDAETLPLSSEEKRAYYGKLSILSSKWAPTAFLPLEEFYTFPDNSPLRKIDRQCIDYRRQSPLRQSPLEPNRVGLIKYTKVI